jgi:glycogen debranching enzyme
VGEDGRPRRLPDGWEIGRGEWELPKYCLPEVNGLWIRSLRSLRGRAEGMGHPYPGILEDSLAKMEAAFRGRMWDGHCLASILDAKTGRSDQDVTSMGIVGLAAALHLFKEEELQNAYLHGRKLIVNRRLRHIGDESIPFGMAITRQVSPYLGDPEYHRSVVWPRDTPYLIEFISKLRLTDTINELLMNALDQMVSESALLYTNEIFGLPVGRNPNPSEGSMNLIPLKNPAQYWSHWCDPYVDRFFSIL